MQIQAINNNVEFGKSHARRAREAQIRRQEDAILSLSDDQIRIMAVESAAIQTNDKKHQKISAGLIASIPVLWGISDAVASRGMDGLAVGKELAENSPKGLTTKFFKTMGKNLNGAAARTAVGVASALSLAGLFAIVDGTILAKRKVAEHSEGARNFERKLPGTTLFATIGAALVSANYIPKGLSALADNISPKTVQNATKKLTKFGEKFNKNSVVEALASGCKNIAQNTPSSVKSVGKYAIALAPLAAVVGALAHAFDHSAQKNKVAVQNYKEVKDLQMDIINKRRMHCEKAKAAMAHKLDSRKQACEVQICAVSQEVGREEADV